MKSTCFTLVFLSCLMGGVFNLLQGQTKSELLPFETLKIMGRIEVTMLASEEEKIEVAAFGDDEERLKISQQNGVLKLSTIRSLVDEDLKIKVKVFYNNSRLNTIYVAGGAEVEFRDLLTKDELYVRAGSGSEVYLEVDADRLDLQAAEGAHLTVKGQCKELQAGANTGGILDGHRLTCLDGRLRAGTGGEVSANVSGALNARANTGGIIRYAGEPNISVSKTILGGEISRLHKR